MIDFATTFVVSVVKVARVMVLWIALYMMDKVYQDAFVQRVLADNEEPPDLRWLVPCALLIDVIAMGAMLAITMLVCAMFKKPSNTFVIDAHVIACMCKDYAYSTAVILAVGVAVAHVAQSRKLLRYQDLGMRGIRAYSELVLMLAMVVVPIPFYRM
jgi:type IV secretory pathway VirB6-like protein